MHTQKCKDIMLAQLEVARECHDVNEQGRQLMLQLKDAIHTADGDFDIRKGLGQKFSKSHVKGSDNYNKMQKYIQQKAQEGVKTNTAKSMFRKEWSKKTYENLKESQVHSKEWEEVDTEHGVYVCFAVLVESFGYNYDPQGALKRACSYADKCIAMGGSWLDNNDMIDEVDYFLLRKEHKTIMKEKWGLYTQASSTGAVQGKGVVRSDASGGDALQTPRPRAKSNDKQAAGTTPTPKRDGQIKDDDAQKRQKTSLDAAIGKATRLKTSYHSASSTATGLLTRISENPKWSWADTDVCRGQLQRALDSLHMATSESSKTILLRDIIELKKHEQPATLEVDLKAFLELQSLVTAVQQQIQMCMKMHKTYEAMASTS